MSNNHQILAIKAERRIVALAVFCGSRLHYAQALQLSSQPEAASTSALEFLNRNIQRFNIRDAVIEDAVGSEDTRAAELIEALEKAVRGAGIPFKRIQKQTLFDAYAVETLASRKELHAIITSFWPQLVPDFHSSVLDAAALGLYARTERLLTINEPEP